MTDACIGHPGGNGIYHYHLMSPCLPDPDDTTYAGEMCTPMNGCTDDIFGWALGGYSNSKSQLLYGISVDGHPLFGPYDDSGELRSCGNLDACNGIL